MAPQNSQLKLTDALLRLAYAPTDIPEQSMQTTKRFVVFMHEHLHWCKQG